MFGLKRHERNCTHVSCDMPEWTVGSDEAGLRLDKYLAAPDRAGSRPKAAAALERGKVFVNDREMTLADAAARVAAGDVVRLWMDRPGSAKRRSSLGDERDLPIVYEDEAVDRAEQAGGPARRAAAAAAPQRRAARCSRISKIYLRRRGRRRPFVVHRIDRDTSGLVLFAKSEAAQLTLKEQFKRHLPERVYQAVVYGLPSPPSGTWRDHLVWDLKALIQKETSPRDPRGQGSDQPLPRARAAGRRVADRSERSSPASAIRSAFRRGCAATRWSASCATSTGRTRCGRSRFRVRRCTRSVWRSAIRPTIARWRSRRRCRTTWPRCSRGCGARYGRSGEPPGIRSERAGTTVMGILVRKGAVLMDVEWGLMGRGRV